MHAPVDPVDPVARGARGWTAALIVEASSGGGTVERSMPVVKGRGLVARPTPEGPPVEHLDRGGHGSVDLGGQGCRPSRSRGRTRTSPGSDDPDDPPGRAL
ncbi:hypothetical protein GCM10027075_75310 [Streptomyces heilongjiangensis]